MNEQKEVAAYQRGWNDAQAWQTPHINPYETLSAEWAAWNMGYQDGGVQSMRACTMLKLQAH